MFAASFISRTRPALLHRPLQLLRASAFLRRSYATAATDDTAAASKPAEATAASATALAGCKDDKAGGESANAAANLVDFYSLSRDELTALLTKEDANLSYRSGQIWQWLYLKGVTDFASMTDLKKELRDELTQKYSINTGKVLTKSVSNDGTIKWLIDFGKGAVVETVYIPSEERGTVCISSQVGCSLSCSFCRTGTQKLLRNLSVGEIVAQYMLAMRDVGDFPARTTKLRNCDNIVLMGQGEPLYNFRNVTKALKIIMDESGVSVSRRKITLSTSGVVPLIPKVASDLGVNLAISLHAVTDKVRDELVPINKTYPLKDLWQACDEYSKKSHRRISFEYVLLQGINDSEEDAYQLAKLVKRYTSHVNLMTFNAWPGTIYKPSSNNRMMRFRNILAESKVPATCRVSRGKDILAACGQLKSSEMEKATVQASSGSKTANTKPISR